MSMLRVLSRRGDERYVWDPRLVGTTDPEALAAVREAERIFAAERARGSSAFRVQKGQSPVPIETFDPQAEQIILVPRVIGG